MKTAAFTILLGFLLIGCAGVGSRGGVAIDSADDLKPNVGRTVVVSAVYHDPGKGSRYLDCGFARLTIGDYSLYTEMPNGELVHQVHEGERILVRGRLRYFPGSRMPSEEGVLVQASSDGTEIIDGRSYNVRAPHFFIEKVELITREEERPPNQALQTTPMTRSEI